jgi:3D (Asp-Asp-Asp) domain-containing protein
MAIATSLLMGVAVMARQEPVISTVKVKIVADGKTTEVVTKSKTVQELYTERNLTLSPTDRSSLPLTAPLTENLTLTVTRVRVETAVERISIPFDTQRVYEIDRESSRRVRTHGKEGERAITYRDYYKDDVRTSRVKISEEVRKPQTQIEVVGLRGSSLASRGSFRGRRILTMVATGYGPSGNGKWGMRTATGMYPQYGVVAVDPRVIPLGTRLFVEGYGSAIAGDTGGAIKGNRIDLCFNSDDEAEKVGRRTVRVLILE